MQPDLLMADLVDEYVYRYHFDLFPVTEDDHLLGCVTIRQIKDIPQGEWDVRRAGDIMSRCSAANTIAADVDAVKALSLMRQSGQSRLMVVEGRRLVGVVALKDLLEFLALKMDLEEAA